MIAMLLLAAATPNELLEEITRLHNRGAVAAAEPLDPAVVAAINTAPARFPGMNPALFRDTDKIVWPKALLELAPAEDVADARRRVEKYLRAARAEMRAGPVTATSRERLAQAGKDLDRWLSRRVAEMSSTEYARAKQFVELVAAAAALAEAPDAAEYLPGGRQAARGKDAAELSRGLTERGLRIVGPRPGDESHYEKLTRALEKYRNALRVAAP